MTAALFRAAGFFLFWLMLAGRDPADVVVGLVSAALATWASLYLLPPSGRGLRPLAIVRFAGHFLRQSLLAGLDVAVRAFRPSLPLQPGFVRFRSAIDTRDGRATFLAVSSLMPGTLPCGSDPTGEIVVHGLDVSQPVAADLAAEEARFRGMVSGG